MDVCFGSSSLIGSKFTKVMIFLFIISRLINSIVAINDFQLFLSNRETIFNFFLNPPCLNRTLIWQNLIGPNDLLGERFCISKWAGVQFLKISANICRPTKWNVYFLTNFKSWIQIRPVLSKKNHSHLLKLSYFIFFFSKILKNRKENNMIIDNKTGLIRKK